MRSDSPLVRCSEHPDDGDLLMNEYRLMQSFRVEPSKRAAFEEAMVPYSNYLLNEYGLYFYKARLSHSFDEASGAAPAAERRLVYALDLYLFTAKRLQEEVADHASGLKVRAQVDSASFRDTVLDPSLYSGYSSTLYFDGKLQLRERVYHAEQMPAAAYTGANEGLKWSLLSLFFHWWLIVPTVQTDFMSILYQIYAFDLAHQGWVPKFVHYFTIPANVLFTLAFLGQFTFDSPLPAPFNASASLVIAGLLSLAYIANGFLKRSKFWGFATAAAIMLLWANSSLYFNMFRQEGAPWYNPTGSYWSNPLTMMYLSSFIEAMSHIIVPQLPPYIVGENHWYDTIKFFLNGDTLYVLCSVVAGFTFSPLVSYISCPHLIGDMTIYMLLTVGYHREFYEEYSRVALKAELSGNPAMDQVPLRFSDLIHGMPGNSGAPLQKSYADTLSKTNEQLTKITKIKSHFPSLY